MIQICCHVYKHNSSSINEISRKCFSGRQAYTVAAHDA